MSKNGLKQGYALLYPSESIRAMRLNAYYRTLGANTTFKRRIAELLSKLDKMIPGKRGRMV